MLRRMMVMGVVLDNGNMIYYKQDALEQISRAIKECGKVQVIKLFREKHDYIGLAEAKDFVDAVERVFLPEQMNPVYVFDDYHVHYA